MPISSIACSRRPRNALRASLSAALGLTLPWAQAGDSLPAWTPSIQDALASTFVPSYEGKHTDKHLAATNPVPLRSPMTLSVTSCADDGTPGTLRSQVAAAINGDAIDLTQLPMTCSKITLDPSFNFPPAIKVYQDSLYLIGPGADQLTIDAAHHSSAFYHFGAGTLGISGLTIANGYYSGSQFPNGGCIYSQGSVSLLDSIVTDCMVFSSSNSVPSRGGGVYTKGFLTMVRSTIEKGYAYSNNGADAMGGGAFIAGSFVAHDSTINQNTSVAISGGKGFSGGLHVKKGNVDIERSTISGNQADVVGGLYVNGGASYTAYIANSTISDNWSYAYGGLWTTVHLVLASSTVAFNKSFSGLVDGNGVFFASNSMTLQNSIIANNSDVAGPSDLGGSVMGAVISGANDLITSSRVGLVLPMNTITACPQLERLADNGGRTFTLALRRTSPALDQGNAGALTTDQRGAQRGAGAADDIGAFELQPGIVDNGIFVDGFDGLCDQ